MTEKKRFTRIVDHSCKEVRIFDEIVNKIVFNIFFNDLDSAICLNGALTEVVDLLNYYENTCLHYEKRMFELRKENEQLKKELFECEKEYIIETYHDNAIRRDEKIQSLKEEFKARFGDVE